MLISLQINEVHTCVSVIFSAWNTLFTVFRYTYGKPVLGTVNAEVCGQNYGYYRRRPVPDMVNVCKKYSMMVRYPLHTQNCYLLGL